MKVIIFDVDGVIIKSNSKKKEVIKNVLQKYSLYDIPGVKEILKLGINRSLTIDKICELVNFDKNAVLEEINNQNAIIESNPINNENVLEFIKSNYEKYIFFTNTALPEVGLKRIIDALNLKDMFQELLAFENGSKVDIINYILHKYDLNSRDVLFIDDNINNINNVKSTGVNTLHFTNYSIDIVKEIKKLT